MPAWARALFSKSYAFASLAVIAVPSAHAYPSFIGYGHASCQLCHFNSAGGGIVTDYGRAVTAAQIAARPFTSPTDDDEVLAEASGFLGGYAMPSWLRAQADYVGMLRTSDLQADTRTKYRNEVMDLSLVVRPVDAVWASVRGGYEADPVESGGGYPRSRFVSREHYLAVEPKRGLRAYAGFMDIAYGLRTDDSSSLARVKSGTGADTQTYGALVHYAQTLWDVSGHAFLGNVLIDPAKRWKGASLKAEGRFGHQSWLGVSTMYSRTPTRNRVAGALTGRFGMYDGSSVIGELGIVREAVDAGDSELGGYAYLQTSGRIARGWHLLVTSEAYSPRVLGPAPRILRLGPGLQAFLLQRLELRGQFLMTRVLGTSTVEEDGMDILGSVHLWF